MSKKSTSEIRQRKTSKQGNGKGIALPPPSGSFVSRATHEEVKTTPNPPLTEIPPPPPHQSLFQYNGTKSLSRKSSTKMKMPPSLAAAKLSLPWPPQENYKFLLAKRREEMERKKLEKTVAEMKEQISKKQLDKDDNDNIYDDHQCCGKSKSCCCATKKQVSQAPSSRKLYMKKKSETSVDTRGASGKQCCSLQQHKMNFVINGDPRRKRGDPYLPVTVPPFKHVHTAWPGFDHAPVPNWKKKYLIAKPWPYQQQRRWSQQNDRDRTLFSDGNLDRLPTDNNVMFLPTPSTETRNFTGRSLASLRPSSSKVSSAGSANYRMSKMRISNGCSEEDAGLPKQRIQLQRVGSCLK